MRQTLLPTVLITLTAATPLAAQKAGAFEIGVFARFTRFDRATGRFDNRVGVGGRLGVFLVRNLALEADGSYTRTASVVGDDIDYIPLHGRLVYHLPVSRGFSFLLGGGYTRNLFRKSYRETANGFTGLAGFVIGAGALRIRLDLTPDYITNPETRGPQPLAGVSQADRNWHLAAQLGLSYVIGRGRGREADSDHDGVLDRLDLCPGTPAGDRVDRSGCTVAAAAPAVSVAPQPATDDDHDGVPDDRDQCLNTPTGAHVNAQGCPLDSDRDRVFDGLDLCPNTPAGAQVDDRGCPLDGDGDGVADGLDRCPNTPTGTPVDAGGCPRDSDGDGVTDDRDKCPGTPPGTTVDPVGCQVLFKEKGKALVLEGVNFESGKAILLPESRDILDRVAESLIANPDVNIEVGGHTDSRGSRALNLRLSRTRAEEVRMYLWGKGVGASRMTIRGYGPDQPVASNATEAGRLKNRRVELKRTN